MRTWNDLDREHRAIIRELACEGCKGVERHCDMHSECEAVSNAIAVETAEEREEE